MKKAIGAGIICATLLTGIGAMSSQVTGNFATARQFFLPNPPTAEQLAGLTADAGDRVVARVRLVGDNIHCERPFPRRIRPEPPERPLVRTPPKYLCLAMLDILEVLEGQVQFLPNVNAPPHITTRYSVRFFPSHGTWDHPRIRGFDDGVMMPATPDQRTREYFIVGSHEPDGYLVLLGVSVGALEYENWRREVYDYGQSIGLRR